RTGRGLWRPLVVLTAVIACLLLHFSDFVWRHAPELTFLQFPWRWLLLLSLALAAFAGLAIRGTAATRRKNMLRVAAVLVVAGCVSSVAWVYFWQPCDEEDNVHAQVATFRDGGFEGTDEYTAVPADNDAIQQDLPQIRVIRSADGDEANSASGANPEWQAGGTALQASEVQIRRWDAEWMSATIRSGGRSGAAFAVLRVMDYPAWQVTVNGDRVETRPKRDDGLMTVPLAVGMSNIDVRYAATPDVLVGRVLSLLAAVLWIGLAAPMVLAARGRRQRIS
ncbi:MAG TPA: hypothetical protein VE178_12280, partial [Silvibacterium sp.]|nr:hypothetical protein [Silvibacterium sp.]